MSANRDASRSPEHAHDIVNFALVSSSSKCEIQRQPDHATGQREVRCVRHASSLTKLLDTNSKQLPDERDWQWLVGLKPNSPLACLVVPQLVFELLHNRSAHGVVSRRRPEAHEHVRGSCSPSNLQAFLLLTLRRSYLLHALDSKPSGNSQHSQFGKSE